MKVGDTVYIKPGFIVSTAEGKECIVIKSYHGPYWKVRRKDTNTPYIVLDTEVTHKKPTS